MANQHRPYQGYPYRDPPVIDVPSIDASTTSRWADLPRRPPRQDNVIYVDIPEDGSLVSESSSTDSRTHQHKKDLDANPVIYIDVPESSSSSVAERVEPEAEPEYVQETIFYNPFDNCRIDQGKDGESVRSSDSEASSIRPPRSKRPTPPNTLNLDSPGSSGYSSNYTPSGLPSMSAEGHVYQARDNGFPASPIPVSEFPQPPPAYTEIDSPVGGRPVGGVVESPRSPVASEPPRTIVITPGSEQRIDEPCPIGLPNPSRKVVYCQHCGRRVHTLVIRKTGKATHVIALTFLCVGLFPMTLLVYLTDFCKHKNHYCPNCNKMIGYEVPVIGKGMMYTKPE